MKCGWCGADLSARSRADAKFCSKRCRQASWRFGVAPARCAAPAGATADRPMRFAYADPPYPGLAHYYPERREVDHAELIRRLARDYPDGWALSTSAVALAGVLSLCPIGVRVLAWVKRQRASSAWEPVIVFGGRRRSRRDGPLDALVYKGRYNAFPGALVGMKPPQFSVWIFEHLGALPGDELDDLFPGSGAVALAWRRYSSRVDLGATCRSDPGDVSARACGDGSRRAGPARQVAGGR